MNHIQISTAIYIIKQVYFLLIFSGENLFCRMPRVEKKAFVEKWKTLKNEVKFTIVNFINLFYLFLNQGKLNTINEKSIIEQLQNSNIMCSCIKTVSTEKVKKI